MSIYIHIKDGIPTIWADLPQDVYIYDADITGWRQPWVGHRQATPLQFMPDATRQVFEQAKGKNHEHS